MIPSRRWFSNCARWRIAKHCRAYLKHVACNSGKVTAGRYPIYVRRRRAHVKITVQFLIALTWQIVTGFRDERWHYMGSVYNWCAIINLCVRTMIEKYIDVLCLFLSKKYFRKNDVMRYNYLFMRIIYSIILHTFYLIKCKNNKLV